MKRLAILLTTSLLLLLSTHPIHAQITVISPDQHPNLYFNQTEIDALRQAVLVDQAPPYAVDTWNAIKNTQPKSKPANLDDLRFPQSYQAAIPATKANFEATLSYLIQPTDAKAQALKVALLSWTAQTTASNSWIQDPQNGGHINLVLPFMYDALYNSGQLTQADKQQLDQWFQYSAQRVQTVKSNQQYINLLDQPGGLHSLDKEGQIRDEYANWWQFQVMAGFLYSLVSHDAATLEPYIRSSVPDDYYRIDQQFSSYAPGTRTFQNMFAGGIYPSGYTWDGYRRNYGFNAPTQSYAGQQAGEGQHYHFFALMPVVFAAEAASHNGFDSWEFQDQALLRAFKTGYPWAHDAHRSTDANADAVVRNWYPLYWTIYRHFPDDPTIRQVITDNRSRTALSYTLDRSAPLWGVLGELDTQAPTPTPETTPEVTPVGHAHLNIIDWVESIALEIDNFKLLLTEWR